MNQLDNVKSKLERFKKYFFYNLLFKSCSFFIFSIFSIFIILNFIEYYTYLSVLIKTTLLFSFSFVFFGALFYLIVQPANKYFNFNKFYSNEDAAISIGNYFPDIKDKLLNTVQLETIDSQELAEYSLINRATSFDNINFNAALEKDKNKKPLILFLFPFILLIITLLWNSDIIYVGSQRLIDFNTAYQPQSPFEISPLNQELIAYKNEDFKLDIKILGKYKVEKVYIHYGGFQKKLILTEENIYSYSFKNMKNSQPFTISVSGYNSKKYKINLLERPVLQKGSMKINFPSYTGFVNKTIDNIGSLTVPEGSSIEWLFNTTSTNELSLIIDSTTYQTKKENNNFSYSKRAVKSSSYEIIMKNENSLNKNKYIYSINVIKDQYPSINMTVKVDTAMYESMILSGEIGDDYGFSSLKLFYKEKKSSNYMSINIPISKSTISQSYFYLWKIDSLLISSGGKLEYYVEASDNDRVNGHKKRKSQLYSITMPDLEEVNKKIENESNSLEEKLKKELEKLKENDKELSDLEEKLKSKKKLDWQDKNNLKEKIEQQKKLHEELNKLKEKFSDIKKKQEKFKNQSENIKQKSDQLQKLMDELLDDETKKLMDELEKLLNENKPKNQEIKDLLDKMKKEEFDLEKELDRAIELYKQLKLDQKMEDTSKKLDELAKEQEKLNKDTENKESKKSKEDLIKEQKDIEKKFEEIKKDLDKLNEMNKELNNDDEIEKNTEKEEKNIDNQLDNANQELQKNQKKKASKSQKGASEEMKKMSQSLMEMMQSGDMEQQEEDIKTLRAILENLVTLSFNQEELMNKFKKIKKVNPLFVEHSSKQLKIKNDSKIIEDSLLALASRNFQIESFVTKELFEMNDKVDKSLEAIKLRETKKITVNQQLAMTSMNNLALLLSDVLQQMQQQMAQQMEGKQQCNKPKNKPGGKKLSMIQKQLNDKIGQLKKSGKQGKQLSEELAKLAAEQEAIREALKEEEGDSGKDGKKEGNGKLEKLMEETEKDLVNKRLLDKTLKRQEDILTRLLESEKSMRERDLDEKREAERAKKHANNTPKIFKDYINEKEKQIELLKSITPSYSGYYKGEINKYFEKETK